MVVLTLMPNCKQVETNRRDPVRPTGGLHQIAMDPDSGAIDQVILAAAHHGAGIRQVQVGAAK